jgi:hypothetical protein
MFVTLVLLACLGVGFTSEPLQAQTPAEAYTIQVIKLLDEPMEVKDFTVPMTLKDAVGLLYEKLGAKGKELPIVVNRAAFREEDDENSFDPNDASVALRPIPRVLSVGAMLRTMLAQMPQKSTFLIREGHIVMVPEKLAKAEHLLQQKVTATFSQRPLVQAMQELSWQTGMSIVVDARGEESSRQSVTATFRNDVTLREAVVMLTRMANMEVEFMPSGVFISAPAKGTKRP